jgi:hypothetical protein
MRVPFTKASPPFQPSSIFWSWWSGISLMIRTLIGPRDLLRILRYEEIGDAVGLGLFACVAKIKDWDLVIKTPFGPYEYHITVEKSVYERFGYHRFILRYYHEAVVISKGRTLPDLILQYHRAGTLKNSLNNPNYMDNRSE